MYYQYVGAAIGRPDKSHSIIFSMLGINNSVRISFNRRLVSVTNKDRFKLPKEKRDDMISEIKYFFLKERDEELGDLAAGMILDFIIEKLAAEFYNQGVYDSQKYMNDRVEELLSIQI
jgi:uncharacterized protein (DUF2164 family)